MDSSAREDQAAEYVVELRFRTGGPAIFGIWSRPDVANHKFTEWLGAYSRPGAVLTLASLTGGTARPVKTWTYGGGLTTTGTVWPESGPGPLTTSL
ncbi:hypothetical protein [Streptomyces filamentosus]|uniref:hypothetical protein n=1 Tax=Streptomyces filamentosus TaxID=67294 RepID=UPI0037D237DE